jgi:hypothetical protein
MPPAIMAMTETPSAIRLMAMLFITDIPPESWQ